MGPRVPRLSLPGWVRAWGALKPYAGPIAWLQVAHFLTVGWNRMLFPDPVGTPETAPPPSNGGAKTGGDGPRAWSVTQLVTQINACMRQSLSRVLVEGEVSNYRRPVGAGHLYFSLKDAGGSVSVAAWSSLARTLRFQLEDGLTVRIAGKIEYYGPHGRLQLIADRIAPVGEGELELAFRQLQQKLMAEGLFEVSRKRPLPLYPERIGIVTGANTAALKDMLESLRRRWPVAEVRLFPVLVQGEAAAGEIAGALRWINHVTRLPGHELDVVLVGRGGGSREDLWAFNREEVARAIAACVVPVVSGVGHEHDVTIADLVADARALTPTDAVSKSTPELEKLMGAVTGARDTLVRSLDWQMERLRQRLNRARPQVLGKLLEGRVGKARQQAANSARRLHFALTSQLMARRGELAVLCGKLDAISPLRVLARGYSLTQLVEAGTNLKRVLTRAEAASPGDTLVTQLAEGHVVSTVVEASRSKAPSSKIASTPGGSV